MDLKIDDDAVRMAVSSALLEQLGAEGQKTLVTAALQYLITPAERTGYGQRNPNSPLQDYFNQAVGVVAQKMVIEIVAENEEFQETIKKQVGEAFLKMEATDFSDRLGSALSQALRDRV